MGIFGGGSTARAAANVPVRRGVCAYMCLHAELTLRRWPPAPAPSRCSRGVGTRKDAASAKFGWVVAPKLPVLRIPGSTSAVTHSHALATGFLAPRIRQYRPDSLMMETRGLPRILCGFDTVFRRNGCRSSSTCEARAVGVWTCPRTSQTSLATNQGSPPRSITRTLLPRKSKGRYRSSGYSPK